MVARKETRSQRIASQGKVVGAWTSSEDEGHADTRVVAWWA
jgi:hypothetical protein